MKERITVATPVEIPRIRKPKLYTMTARRSIRSVPAFAAAAPAGIARIIPEKLRREPRNPTMLMEKPNSSDAKGSISGIAARYPSLNKCNIGKSIILPPLDIFSENWRKYKQIVLR